MVNGHCGTSRLTKKKKGLSKRAEYAVRVEEVPSEDRHPGLGD